MDEVKDAKTVQNGHHDIANDEVWQFPERKLNAELSILCREYLIVGQSQNFCSILPYPGVIFYQKDFSQWMLLFVL
jgi:hypothetical protein